MTHSKDIEEELQELLEAFERQVKHNAQGKVPTQVGCGLPPTLARIKILLSTAENKARIDELQKLADYHLTNAGHKYLTKRYTELEEGL